MKKRLTLYLAFFSVVLFGQNNKDSKILVIEYSFSDNIYSFPIAHLEKLIQSDKASVYVGKKGEKRCHLVTENGKEWDGNSLPTQLRSWCEDSIGEVIFKDFASKRLVMRHNLKEKSVSLTEEPVMPTINWKILNEEKKIGAFNCQKATTRFRGRNYTAWFAREIPIPNGPWKLHGLPGLILEASDDANQVVWSYISIKKISASSFNVAEPSDGEKMDYITYKKLEDIEFEKAKRQALSLSTEGRGGLTVIRGGPTRIEIDFEN